LSFFDNLFNKVDKLFDKVSGVNYKKPFSQISQNNKLVEIKVKLPGINKKDILIKVGKNFVEIKAEKKIRKVKETKRNYEKKELYKGFYRKISLPDNIDYEKAKAKFVKENLIIQIPKRKKLINKIKIK